MLPPIRGSQIQGHSGGPRRAASRGFTLPETSPQSVAGAEPVQCQPAILCLEGGWTPAERDAAARRRATAVLQALEELQLAVLAGGIEVGRLSRLALLAEGERGADPVLREIIGDISLRARIEVARRTP